MINPLKDEKGQILPFAALTLLALVMFWMTVVNVGKMISDRIMLQNAADAAAQSVVCYQARSLNLIGLLNMAIGSRLIICPLAKWENKSQVRHLREAQDRLRCMFNGRSYYRYVTYSLANRIARENGADGVHWMSLSLISDLELKRNKGFILWWKRIRTPWGSFRIPWRWERRGEKWLEMDREEFDPKVTVIAYKNYEGETFFPIGKNLLRVRRMPPIYAIASARPYNIHGPGFPNENEWWGITGAIAILRWLLGLPGYDAHLIPVGSPYEH